MSHLGTKEGNQTGRDFELLETDVVITPFAKCGTTWLQQTVHGLRTRGDTDFDDISRVVPWLETAADLGLDLNAPQRGSFRAFKSHWNWYDVPKGGRYIVSFRDPKDALVSLYRFFEGWFFEPGTVSISEFARARYMADAPKGYWEYLISWWSQRDNPNVLLLCYEEMRSDFRSTIHVIADFLGIALDAELESIVMKQSSLDYMLANKDKFDDRLMRERSERVAGFPPGSDSAKVRAGQVGAYLYELPPDVVEEMDQIWRDEIEPEIGFGAYEELRSAMRSQRGTG